MTNEVEERRTVNNVTDKPVERGMLSLNILSAVIAALLFWVGSSIETLKETSIVNRVDIEYIKGELTAIKDKAHTH